MSKKRGDAPLATPDPIDEARLISTEDHIELEFVIYNNHTYFLTFPSFRDRRRGSGVATLSATTETFKSSSILSGQKMPSRTSPPSTPGYVSSPSTSTSRQQNHISPIVQTTKPDVSLQQIHTMKPDDLLQGKVYLIPIIY